jgi:hypothetical protein
MHVFFKKKYIKFMRRRHNLFSKCFNSIISKFPGKLSDLIILGKAYQHPCISSIRITIAISRNNWFQNYLNSIFGQFPGRLSDLLFGQL